LSATAPWSTWRGSSKARPPRRRYPLAEGMAGGTEGSNPLSCQQRVLCELGAAVMFRAPLKANVPGSGEPVYALHPLLGTTPASVAGKLVVKRRTSRNSDLFYWSRPSRGGPHGTVTARGTGPKGSGSATVGSSVRCRRADAAGDRSVGSRGERGPSQRSAGCRIWLNAFLLNSYRRVSSVRQ